MTRIDIVKALEAIGIIFDPCNYSDTEPGDESKIYYVPTDELRDMYNDYIKHGDTDRKADTVTEHEYKRRFFQAHNNDWHVETSELYGEHGDHYMKTYICADGAQMSEVNGPEWMDADIIAGGVRVGSESVRVWVTELWTTDDPASVKYVCKY